MKYLLIMSLMLSIGCYTPPQPHFEDVQPSISLIHEVKPGASKVQNILQGLKAFTLGNCHFPKILKIGGMTTINDSLLLITDIVTKSIYSYNLHSLDCENIETIKTLPIQEPIDISSSQAFIFVLDGVNKQILQFDTKYTLINIISLNFTEHPTKILIRNQSIYIVDTQAHAIFELDLDGKIKRTILSIENVDCFNPIDLVNSKDDTFYILDGITHKIYHVSHDFILLENSFNHEQKLSFPNSISQSKQGLLFVNNFVTKEIDILYPNGMIHTTINSELIQNFSSSGIELFGENNAIIFNPTDHSLYILEINL